MSNQMQQDLENADGLSVGMESMIPYPMYYRRHGVRRAVQLAGPVISTMEELDLPRNSILHFVSDNESLYGIPQDDYILRNEPRLIMVEHITQLADTLGPPRPTRLLPGQMTREYHRKYRKTRPLLRLELALRDPRTLVVENYALLPHLYRYMTSYFSGYNKWWNIQATVWNRVGELAKQTDRQQYLQCRLPRHLPSLIDLRKGESRTTRATLEAFTQSESLFLLEVWKWLGENRKASVLSRATPAQLANMNLIFVESGKWVMVNLGLLDQWRKPTDEEIAAGAQTVQGAMDPFTLQKRFLRMLMYLIEERNAGTTNAQAAPSVKTEEVTEVTEPAAVVIDKTPAQKQEQAKAPEEKPVELKVEKPAPVKIAVPATDTTKTHTLKLGVGMDIDKLPEIPVEETEENARLIDEAITKDLETLAELTREVDEAVLDSKPDVAPEERGEVPTPVMKYKPKQRDLVRGVMDKADMLADMGAISGPQYRLFQNASKAFEKIPDPYGSGETLAEQIVLDPKVMQLSKKPQIPDIPTVLDKSMLKSSLLEFDSKYITEVMPKDVTRAVMALQHAGVAVTGYSIEEIEDAMNSYEAHTVQLTPVQGKVSTITFRIPKVSTDGTFRANGVRYRLRKQRGDVPIRKVNSRTVSLTSYYNRVFVARSEKQVHNYAGWMTNQIAAMGMDPENQTVTHPMMSNVFNSNFKTPRAYSIMAARFRSFHVRDLEFFFDYGSREKQFGEEAVKAAEGKDLIVVGRRGSNLLVMDNSDTVYEAVGEDLITHGTIPEIVGLTSRAPSEMAEIKIFSKQVPVGIFLAYHLGLTQLLDLLSVTPRRVTAGERVYLSDDEFALKFEDETLVIPRDNRIAELVLSGLVAYEDTTRNYPVHLFDKKDIYFNVLEHSGLGIRFLREMDLLLDLFVDPITEEILQQMGEPTDFIGLVLRSCELLQTDWSPDETDLSYQRIKGYERVAGAVYAELSKAIRLQRARGAVANARIELPPYAVWQAIQQDSAIKLVEESNPVHNLREVEEITFGGVGGRSDRSMVRRTRVFHDSDMGVISESTKDSAAVAVTTFMTADPNLENLRGLTGRFDPETMGPASLVSSSALLAPAADRDDQ